MRRPILADDQSIDAPADAALPWWSRLNEVRAAVRIPVKLGLFIVVLVAVLFPSPRLLIRQVHRLAHLDRMIEPDAPGLDALIRQLQADLPADATRRQIQRRVQALVRKTIPYDWDWNTWGVADYIPTVAELLDKGREDCDGRAVLAASLLRRLGQPASLATDLRHVWVAVGKDELMGPGGAKSAVSTPTGTRVRWRTLHNVPRTLAFGAAVFPLIRELILLATAFVLLMYPKTPLRWLIGGAVLLAVGLAFLRLGVDVQPDFRGFTERLWASWAGLLFLLAGVTCLWRTGRRVRMQDRT